MKGIIIYGSPEGAITFCEFVNEASYELKNYYGSQEIASCLKGEASKVSKAKCSPEDTYDFETGVLIALMKMCGRDKVIKACDELYKDDNYKNALQEMTENNEKLMKENNYLKYTNSCRESAIESLENTRDLLINKNNELIEENEKLKLDCEKLQHGYIDTDMMFCGGRTCGKQYTFLRNLFKWISMDKVEAAYKEAYNTNLPLWQKEVLKQMYGIYKTGKWTKPPTKREEMWAEIFELHKESDVIIKVKKEDVNTFLHEIENKIPEITWLSTVKIFETKYTIGDIYEELKTRDMIYFRLWKDNSLTYSSNTHVYPYRELKHIDYLPPMRWDLFKKGRLVVGVRKEHYDEFISNATEHIYRFNKHKPYDNFNYSFFIYDKNVNFIEAIGHSQVRQIKEMNNHKVYYWEDVR